MPPRRARGPKARLPLPFRLQPAPLANRAVKVAALKAPPRALRNL
jgi:hypothetical protein